MQKYASSQVALAASSARSTIFLSVDPRKIAAVAEEIQRLGGSIRFEQDAVGYIRAAVPAVSIKRLEGSPGVDAFEVSDTRLEEQTVNDLMKGDSALRQTALERWRRAPVLQHPYFASIEIGRDVWLRRHPTYDGRGVVIAIVEPGGPDFLHPEFGSARTFGGKLVPKFLDVVPVSQSNSEHQIGPFDSFWLDVSRQVVAKGRNVLWNGMQYRVPRPGLYAITTLHVPLDKVWSFSLLWDKNARTVRLAPNGRHDFIHAEEVGEYRRTQRFGHLQIDGKTLGYAVFVTPDGKHIYISLGTAFHATMATSTAAGNRLYGGLFTGVAPGAQIISYVEDGYTNPLEGVLSAAADPRVDIVSCSCLLGIRESQTTSVIVDHVLARFAQAFHKPFTSASVEVEPAVIGVAPYTSSRMFERNLGITGSPDDMWAPQIRDDGLVFPDILQPERSLAADSRFLPSEYLGGFLRTPRNYMIGGGASNATPFAAGIIADLISAEKQRHIPVRVRDLRAALWTASSWVALPDQKQIKQRLPLLEPVWNTLERAARLNVPAFNVRAPITRLGKPVMTGGWGLLDESVTVGHAVRRIVLVTQYGGGAGCCALRLQRNDGSFKIDTRASMKTGNVWHIALTGRPSTPGDHVAELHLVDQQTGIVFQAVPLILRTPLAQSTTKLVLRGNTQLYQYIAGQMRHPVQVDVTLTGEQNVSLLLISPDNHFVDLASTLFYGRTGTIAQSWRAAASVRLQQKGNARIYAVIAPPGRGLWTLAIRKNQQAANFEKPGPYNPGQPSTVTVTVH